MFRQEEGLYAKDLETLRGLPDEKLVRMHDDISKGAVVNPDYYLAELARRDIERREKRMLYLTVAIAVMTAANVVFVAVSVF